MSYNSELVVNMDIFLTTDLKYIRRMLQVHAGDEHYKQSLDVLDSLNETRNYYDRAYLSTFDQPLLVWWGREHHTWVSLLDFPVFKC